MLPFKKYQLFSEHLALWKTDFKLVASQMWKLTLSFITNLSRIHVCIYFDVWPWCEQMWSSLSTSNNRFELRWYTPGMQANLKRSKTFSYQLKILNKIIFTQIISISKKNPDFWPVSRDLQTYLTSNEFQNFCKTFVLIIVTFQKSQLSSEPWEYAPVQVRPPHCESDDHSRHYHAHILQD